jgi:CRP/FNR family cyclic AMP-dependent transcriptional regulator
VTRAGLVQAARAASAIASDPGRDREAAGAWAGLLAEVPLFSHVSGRQIRKIAGKGTIVRLDQGATIVRARQSGDAFYVVLDGRASVLRGRSRPPAPIGVGGYFGEMALIDGSPRSATVVAETDVTCLRLGRRAFLDVVRREPSVSLAILQALAERIRALEKDRATA